MGGRRWANQRTGIDGCTDARIYGVMDLEVTIDYYCGMPAEGLLCALTKDEAMGCLGCEEAVDKFPMGVGGGEALGSDYHAIHRS